MPGPRPIFNKEFNHILHYVSHQLVLLIGSHRLVWPGKMELRRLKWSIIRKNRID
ncbi:hypothetical protein BJX65DRAFT_290434 [Aspergillus insuetus]